MPRPTAQQRRVEKIIHVTEAIRAAGWTSLNEFLLAFYTNKEPSIMQQSNTSLRFTDGQTFAPDALLDAWMEHGPAGPSRHELKRSLTRQTAKILIDESTAGCRSPDLRLPTTKIDNRSLANNFALDTIATFYLRVLPCLWLLLYTLLTAPNDYERKHQVKKKDKENMARRVTVVVISILLHGRNRATNVFQVVVGLFLASAGSSKRVIDTLAHMGLCVGYKTVQRGLVGMSKSAQEQARVFARSSTRMWAIVYDNINFTLRKASQRIDSVTQQLNATTLALFSLPKTFGRAAFQAALSIRERNVRSGRRARMTLASLKPTEERQQQVMDAFKHAVRTILLEHAPGLRKQKKFSKRLRKAVARAKPAIRVIGSEKTEFYPLPALDEEEASVRGTINVVKAIYTRLLGFAAELVDTELRLMVGDWLTIRNLRLMKTELADELSSFATMNWVQEASMPFHFQINAVHMLFKTHLGYSGDNNPSALEAHRRILRRAALDPKKPEYNRGRELIEHSLIARVLDCTRVLLNMDHINEIRAWKPEWTEFEALVDRLVSEFASTQAAHSALDAGDEVLGHSVLFIRDALFFWEFGEAIRDADVGRMWVIYDFWVFMMRGAGLHNYANELLEMKAQYEHELPELLRNIMERTWLVNRWGKPGRSIPTDLYLEHNNGFIKNSFAAMGSAASMEYIQTKASAPVEVLRTLSKELATWFGVAAHNRKHQKVSSEADIRALCVDLAAMTVHTLKVGRRVPPPGDLKKSQSSSKKTRKAVRKHGVRDVLLEGLVSLTQGNTFEKWQSRADTFGERNDEPEDEDEWQNGSAFDGVDRCVDVDASADPELMDEYSLANETQNDAESTQGSETDYMDVDIE